MQRTALYDNASQRVGTDGCTERLCTLCNKWDRRKRSAFYANHGVGKCSEADPIEEDRPGSEPAGDMNLDEMHDEGVSGYRAEAEECEGKRCPARRTFLQLRLTTGCYHIHVTTYSSAAARHACFQSSMQL